MPCGGYLAAAHRVGGILGVVDQRDDHGNGAGVQRLADGGGVVRLDADQPAAVAASMAIRPCSMPE